MNSYEQDNDFSLETSTRDYLRILFRQKAVIITVIFTVIVTVIIGLMLQTPEYEAQVKMLISASKQVEAPYYRDLVGYQDVIPTATQAEIVKSDPVLDRVVRALGLYFEPLDYESKFCSPLKAIFVNARAKMLKAKLDRMKKRDQDGFRYRMALDDLRNHVDIEPIKDTNMFLIKVDDYSAYGSAILANVVSRSYVMFDLEQQLAELELKYGEKHQAVKELKEIINSMEKSLNGEPVSNIEAIGPASVKIIEQAQIPLKPKGLPKITILILAVFMSIFLGVILAFIFEYLDPTFKSPKDIESQLNLPFLGFIPRIRSKEKLLSEKSSSKSLYAHSFQVLSDQLYLIIRDKKLKSILMTSTETNEGTAPIIANLGHVLSQKMGHHVLMIDANLRNPLLHRLLKINHPSGLSDIIEGKSSLNGAVNEIAPRLHFISAGKTELNPVILLDSPKVKDLLEEAKKKYEIILFDCPNMKSFKDPVVLLTYTDAAVLVINEGKTRREVVKTALLPLEGEKDKILGVILNNRTFPIPRFLYERV